MARLTETLLFVSILAAVFVATATADLGVGVNTGRMEVARALDPGAGYHLPPLTVINTGDERAMYDLSVSYLDGQTERRPDANWFTFSPDSSLLLEPGESERVTVSIDLPASAEAGDYFALLRAQVVADQPGVTSVGVAAATKLYFSVSETAWVDAWRHRVDRWLSDNAASLLGLLAVGFLALGVYRLRRLPFRVRLERR